jgi:hypothetical protein
VFGDALRLETRRQRRALVRDLREAAEPRTIPPATTLTEGKRSFEAIGARVAERLGTHRPRMRINARSFDDDLVPVLEKPNTAVFMNVSYGVINDALGGRFSGSTTFRRGHAVAITGLRRTEEGRFVSYIDPTHDSRRPGIPGPGEADEIPLWLLRRAAGAWGRVPIGEGQVRCGIVRVARPLAEPDDADDTPTTPGDPVAVLRERLADERAARADVEARLQRSSERVAALRGTLTELRGDLEAAAGRIAAVEDGDG